MSDFKIDLWLKLKENYSLWSWEERQQAQDVFSFIFDNVEQKLKQETLRREEAEKLLICDCNTLNQFGSKELCVVCEYKDKYKDEK